MMVLTAKFGCARLYSRIISPDVDSRRLNLQACYAEYQWIIAYAQKFNVQIFQEELGLCREMVTARVASAARNHFFSPPSFCPCSLLLSPTGIAHSRSNCCPVVTRLHARCIVRMMLVVMGCSWRSARRGRIYVFLTAKLCR